MRTLWFGFTASICAFLLFAVQPVAGATLLPWLGGVASVWTACLLFFQGGLLVGYGLVWAGRRLPMRWRTIAYLVFLALALVPHLTFSSLARPQTDDLSVPWAWALAFLAQNVGFAFVILSTCTPMLSDWLGQTESKRSYTLYAMSNAGSFLALMAYPLVVEPNLSLPTQYNVFRYGLALALSLLIVTSLVMLRARGSRPEKRSSGDDDDPESPERSKTADEEAPVDLRRRVKWVGWAALGTALLAGASESLTTDLAPTPLLWVVPLGVYLLTFVIAFSGRPWARPHPHVARAACLMGLILIYATVFHANSPVWVLLGLHLAFLGAAAWVLHARLAGDAPPVRFLPEFYFWIAVGGALGTVIAAIVAPFLLPDRWEYPIAIALACAARPFEGVVRPDRPWKKDALQVGVVIGLFAIGTLVGRLLRGGGNLGQGFSQLQAIITVAPALLWSYRWMPLRRRFSLCLVALISVAAFNQLAIEGQQTRRSFFGVTRVVEDSDLGVRYLLHGTTLHGYQMIAERDDCVLHAYYDRSGPLGTVMDAYRSRERERDSVIVIGLGSGNLACYAHADETWTFIEINPDVIEFAEDPSFFTYLANSPAAEIRTIEGDGRLVAEGLERHSAGLVVLDAFNSDAIPGHLLTSEAMRIMLDRVDEGGWVVFHVSNRALNLPPIVARAAAAQGASARLVHSSVATLVVVSAQESALEPLSDRSVAVSLSGSTRPWTDDHIRLLDAL